VARRGVMRAAIRRWISLRVSRDQRWQLLVAGTVGGSGGLCGGGGQDGEHGRTVQRRQS
jgi:hypothetical protein